MASFGEQLSGLAGKIRASTSSEQFDFNNYDESRTRQTLLSAFGSPLTAPNEMVRFQFIVGGGKLVRGRYDDSLSKWCAAAMRELNYQEDSSASCLPDCQGTYKLQHDTSQNLKYFFVFPNVAALEGKGKGSVSSSSASADTLPFLDTTSKEYLVVTADVSTFQEMVSRKVISWSQKKKLLELLKEKAEEFIQISNKAITGRLEPIEEEISNSNSGCDEEKIAWLQGEIKSMVENGQLTQKEKAEVLSNIANNLKTAKEEIEVAKKESKTKLFEKLKAKELNLQARKQTIENITPIDRRLVHGDMIQKCWARLFPLQHLEEKERRKELTLKDLEAISEKSDIEDQITQMQNASRGWFEEETIFEEMCRYEANEAIKKFQSKKDANKSKSTTKSSGSVGGGSSKGARAVSSWSTVGKSSGGGSHSLASTSKNSSKSTGFAALADSDSD